MREVKYLSLGGNVVSDNWMDAPLEDSEIRGQEHDTIWRRDFKITKQPGEAEQNEKLSFTALSHQIENVQPERGEWELKRGMWLLGFDQ